MRPLAERLARWLEHQLEPWHEPATRPDYDRHVSDVERDLPTEVSDGAPGIFDRFADAVARVTAKAWFFACCVLLVTLWAPSILIIGTLDTWQLIINTATTIVTFLLVGLMQNSTARTNAATQQKLNAICRALLDPTDVADLEQVIGLEDREAS